MLRELLKRCQEGFQSLSVKGKELQVLLKETFDKVIQVREHAWDGEAKLIGWGEAILPFKYSP